MKCTRNACGKETGKPVPHIWWKHQTFDPIVLLIFFKGTNTVTQEDLDLLDNFVCIDCMTEWLAYKRRSNSATQAAKKRKKNEDYSI